VAEDPALAVGVVRLDPDLPLPRPALPGDAGWDLFARVGTVLAPGGGRAVVPTGIALVLPEGSAALVLPRSGLAVRHGVTCLNAPGLIDAGYRGEVQVVLVNTDPVEPYEVHRGDRIAQLLVQRLDPLRVFEAEPAALAPTARGTNGFGHSGR
jgi:dUTP pyrophosphatase